MCVCVCVSALRQYNFIDGFLLLPDRKGCSSRVESTSTKEKVSPGMEGGGGGEGVGNYSNKDMTGSPPPGGGRPCHSIST